MVFLHVREALGARPRCAHNEVGSHFLGLWSAPGTHFAIQNSLKTSAGAFPRRLVGQIPCIGIAADSAGTSKTV